MKLLKLFLLINVFVFSVPTIMAAESGVAPGLTTGTVVETMDSGGYTYLKIEDSGIWIATSPLPQPISVGDQVEYSGGMEMRDFYSKTLDRTFDSILFIQNVKRAGQSADVMHAAAMNSEGGSVVPIPKHVAVTAPAIGEINHLTEGKTVADIIAEPAEFNGKIVILNAKVMKVSKNIVGKNWITLQDGTGTAPDNKLLATTQELVSPGDTVIAKGIVRTDIDIGSGYEYKVLMEEVTFSASVE